MRVLPVVVEVTLVIVGVVAGSDELVIAVLVLDVDGAIEEEVDVAIVVVAEDDEELLGTPVEVLLKLVVVVFVVVVLAPPPSGWHGTPRTTSRIRQRTRPPAPC